MKKPSFLLIYWCHILIHVQIHRHRIVCHNLSVVKNNKLMHSLFSTSIADFCDVDEKTNFSVIYWCHTTLLVSSLRNTVQINSYIIQNCSFYSTKIFLIGNFYSLISCTINSLVSQTITNPLLL